MSEVVVSFMLVNNIKRATTNSSDLDEFLDCFMLVHCCTFLDKVNLILQNYEMLEPHDFNSCEMLRRLRLWAAFIRCNQKQGSIHDSCSIKHCSHENVVALFKEIDTLNTNKYNTRIYVQSMK
jgi:hypothetical protein